jgi:solute carrier family 35 (adenosine 3'-phospho 5'-phosphosulfate transporter), member B3
MQMKAQWRDYGLLTAILLMSSGFSNTALGYINYPTKVVFRSCKLIPTMGVAVVLNKKTVAPFQFFYGGLLSVGMVSAVVSVLWQSSLPSVLHCGVVP